MNWFDETLSHLMMAGQTISDAFRYLQDTSLPAVFLILLAGIVGATEAGNLIGRRQNRRAPDDKDASGLAAASLGLLALLIGFTYSMALSRYELRRQVVLEEANAIGSTVNFALMLPKAGQAPILADLKKFTALRIKLGTPYNRDLMASQVAQSNTLETDLWSRAVAVSAAAPQSLPAYRFIASLNEMNNIAEKRVTALRNHVPVVITFMLAGTAIIAMGFSGYAAGLAGGRRRYASLIMTVLIAGLIVLMLDLQRPDRGSIEIPTQPLQDTLAAFPP